MSPAEPQGAAMADTPAPTNRSAAPAGLVSIPARQEMLHDQRTIENPPM